jgi:methyltransferase (TIGR00027 family)
VRTGEPSTTARLVAAARLRAPRVPFPGGRAEDDELLARDVAGDLVDRPTPLQRHLEERTAFVDRELVGALDDGVRQVVLAAAGYDGRAFRYARPGVRWFELDHPATQADKRERLARLGIPTADTTFVAADFRTDPVAERLIAAGCDPAARSVVVCEGLAIYLEPAVLERLLGELARATGPGSTLLITASTAATGARAEERRARLRDAVAALGEPMMSALSAEDADALLQRAGWRPAPDQLPDDRREGFLRAVRAEDAAGPAAGAAPTG